MTDSANGRKAPLPPVTTRWEAPAGGTGRGKSSLIPPYVPGAPQTYGLPQVTEESMPLLRSFDSQPVEEQYAAGIDSAETAATVEMPEIPELRGLPEMLEAVESPVMPEAMEAVAFGSPREMDAPVEADSPVPQMLRAPDEPLMPWEEEPGTQGGEAHAESGPHVTRESSETARHDLDDWESAIDPDGGHAAPAWGDQQEVEGDAFSPPPQLDDEGSVMPQAERADRSFPLDAFIIPPDSKRLPKGLEHAEELHLEIAEALAQRLEAVAQRLRREGFAGLLHHQPEQEPIDTLIAGVLAGYLSNRTDA